MTDEELKQAMAELQEVVRCRCDEAYRDRGLHDPQCECDSAEAVKIVADRIEALTKERDREKAYAFQCAINLDTALEQLTAARQDAKAAEDELEMQEQEACMMERAMSDPSGTDARLDRIEELEAKLAECEARLGKAVEALEFYTGYDDGPIARATLAELKGESHE